MGDKFKKSDKFKKIKMVILFGILIFGASFIAINIHTGNSNQKVQLFPGILGDMILSKNETGTNTVNNMILYDDFRGNFIQGYKSTYFGRNGTMIVFIAQMYDNISAEKYFNDMAIRLGYNSSINQTDFNNNVSIIKLPVNNPIVYVIKKNRSDELWHYTFTKKDKVYWIGFNNSDIEYQLGILREAYIRIDEEQ